MTGVEQGEAGGAGESERGRKGGLSWLVWMLIVVLLYVLSSGPVMRFHSRRVLQRGHPISFLYRPVLELWLHTHFGGRVFDWYFVDVWQAPVNKGL